MNQIQSQSLSSSDSDDGVMEKKKKKTTSKENHCDKQWCISKVKCPALKRSKGQFQDTSVISLNMKLGRDVHKWLQNTRKSEKRYT